MLLKQVRFEVTFEVWQGRAKPDIEGYVVPNFRSEVTKLFLLAAGSDVMSYDWMDGVVAGGMANIDQKCLVVKRQHDAAASLYSQQADTHPGRVQLPSDFGK